MRESVQRTGASRTRRLRSTLRAGGADLSNRGDGIAGGIHSLSGFVAMAFLVHDALNLKNEHLPLASDREGDSP